jgi:hypothetical protein
MRKWNQPKCPAINEWTTKCEIYVYTMAYDSVMKNKIRSFSGKWMVLEINMLSKISQVQKDKHSMFSLI